MCLRFTTPWKDSATRDAIAIESLVGWGASFRLKDADEIWSPDPDLAEKAVERLMEASTHAALHV